MDSSTRKLIIAFLLGVFVTAVFYAHHPKLLRYWLPEPRRIVHLRNDDLLPFFTLHLPIKYHLPRPAPAPPASAPNQGQPRKQSLT